MLLTAHRLHHPDNISRTLLLSMVDATEFVCLFGAIHRSRRLSMSFVSRN